MTIKELLKACQEEVAAGNGDRDILISQDEEGNGYHSLEYSFTSDPEEIAEIRETVFFEGTNKKSEDVVLLG